MAVANIQMTCGKPWAAFDRQVQTAEPLAAEHVPLPPQTTPAVRGHARPQLSPRYPARQRQVKFVVSHTPRPSPALHRSRVPSDRVVPGQVWVQLTPAAWATVELQSNR